MATHDVFRFVTLRGPNKISSTTAAVNFIDLEAEFNYLLASDLYADLSDDLGAIDPYTALHNTATAFAATADYFSSIKSIDSAFPGFADYYFSVQTIADTKSLSVLDSEVHTLLGGDISAYFSDTDHQALITHLIDTIITDIILDKNDDKRNHATAVLILLHIARRLTATPVSLKQSEVPRVFYATPVLPSPLFPLPYPRAGTDTPPDLPDYDAIREDLRSRFEMNENVRALILSFLHENLLANSNYPSIAIGTIPSDPGDPSVEETFLLDYLQTRSDAQDVDKISVTQWDTFTTDQQTYLESLKLPQTSIRISRALRALDDIGEGLKKQFAGTVKSTSTIVAVGGSLYEIKDQLKKSPVVSVDTELSRGDCMVKPMAVADLRVVKQSAPCYQPGEIAHIENVMIGEIRDRSTRRLERLEETTSISSEKETEEERTHQTTERFELQQETSKQLETDMEFSAGLNVSASWGPVSIGTTLNFATSTSSTTSSQQATQYAKETVDKSVKRILERVKEERTTKLIREYEENIRQQFSNPTNIGDSDQINQVGIYRWIDKEYTCTLHNYGKRLMYEFMIPEPAAFHLFAKQTSPVEGLTLQKPADPVKDGIRMIDGSQLFLTSPDVLDENNVNYFIAAYGVTGVEPMPPLYQVASLALNNSADGNKNVTGSKNEIKVPAGYLAQRAQATGGVSCAFAFLSVGMNTMPFIGILVPPGSWTVSLDNETDVVPVAYWIPLPVNDQVLYLNIDVFCVRSNELKQSWKIKTFEAIMIAYQKLKMEYDEALNALKSQMAFRLTETNPAYKREIEKQELKKGALRIASKKSILPIGAFNAMSGNGGCENLFPEFDICDSLTEGRYVRFLEESFDWEHMTYTYYPYYYARVCQWQEIYQLEDSDFLFGQFLKAGYARVVVPVTPGMEKHILYYIQTGQLWDGENPPLVMDNYLQSLFDDLALPPDEEEPQGEFTVMLPTSLVALQCKSGCIPGEGLPCGDGTGDDGGGDPTPK